MSRSGHHQRRPSLKETSHLISMPRQLRMIFRRVRPQSLMANPINHHSCSLLPHGTFKKHALHLIGRPLYHQLTMRLLSPLLAPRTAKLDSWWIG
nr:hypothetical protein I308_02048 [Cryptococcus tetragattii IND107]